MPQKELDHLDRQILSKLTKDSRKPFTEMARELKVSSGTIHVRVDKMKEAGIIKGSKIILDHQKLGFGVCTFVGINLRNARDYAVVLENLELFDEVVEAHYTTGAHNIFLKVLTKSIQDLHLFLIEKLQQMKEVQSTETFISLDTPIQRELIP